GASCFRHVEPCQRCPRSRAQCTELPWHSLVAPPAQITTAAPSSAKSQPSRCVSRCVSSWKLCNTTPSNGPVQDLRRQVSGHCQAEPYGAETSVCQRRHAEALAARLVQMRSRVKWLPAYANHT